MTKVNNFSNEIWRDIEGYEGRYQISNFGRVKNTATQYIRKPIQLRDGYCYVSFQDGNKKKKHLIHRLVAKAFILNPENKPCVNHIDCVRSNNVVSNLEWCTHQENTQHGINVGNINTMGYGDNNIAKLPDVRKKISEKLSGGKHYKARKVIDLQSGKVYDSIRDAANSINLDRLKLKQYLREGRTNPTSFKYY